MSYDFEKVRGVIEHFSTCNPTNDPHGLLDEAYTKMCAKFIERTAPGAPETENPLTLEEWAGFRARDEYMEAYARENNATDPWVFLFVLRDHLAFSAGGAPALMSLIGMFIDSAIHRSTCQWATPSGASPGKNQDSK